jgi:ParB/RepB/Spo0J family partition protein
MEKGDFREIPLTEILPNPLNPRKTIAGRKLDELVASIKQQGVIEPIIVRAVQKGYEVVAGERRFKAAGLAGHTAIPALVRVLTDLEAYDFMIIENLQREDLTELEEAESFKGYLEKHGDGALADLAEKTSISPQYIRGRVAVLGLPKPALEAWKAAKIKYGHLQQLLRVSDPKRLKELTSGAIRGRWADEPMTVAQLKQQIDRESIDLKYALFDLTECLACRNNSKVQHELFDLGDGKAACLDPACFKKKLNAWLGAHWKETEVFKKTGALGFLFDSSVGGISHETFYGGAPKRCHGCEQFVAVLEANGKLSDYPGLICLGDKKCFNKRPDDKKQDRGGAGKSAAGSRATWHGEYFRDRFFRARLPEVISNFDGDSETVKRLLLSSLVQESDVAAVAVAKELHLRVSDWGVDGGAVFKAILKAPWKAIIPLLRAAAAAVLLEGEADQYPRGNFSPAERQAAGEYMGISVAKEFAMDEEYLTRKTRAEILAFGKKLKLFDDPKMKAYLARKKAGEPKMLKKSELVDAVLKSGIKLVGRVPDEVLKVEK